MTGYDVAIESLPACGFLDLRGGEDIRQACGGCLGIELPTIANTMVNSLTPASEEYIASCISPDHWILQVPSGTQHDVLRSLEHAALGSSHSFVDVSDMYVRIQLSGRETREVLSQGISIDIHPRVFPPGATARTGLAKTTIQLRCVDASPTFIITAYSSYRQYVLDWLSVAAGNS